MICIVGASLAGDTAAATLRAEGYTGRIVLIGDEAAAPYDRPPLSKEALAGDGADERLFLRAASWYAEQDIELRLGQAVGAIDRGARTLALADGTSLPYEKLLLATGARARDMPGMDQAPLPVFAVRTLDDTRRLRAQLQPGARVAIIGAGVIGLEVAATARARGCSVDVIDLAPRVMSRVLPPMLSDYMSALHRRHGVRLHLDAGSAAFASVGGQAGIATGTHGFIAADLAVIGIGIVPNSELADAAGLACQDGVLVDAFCRSSDPDIFACGDVARYPCPFEGRAVRSENWRHAQDQAVAAACNMLGREQPYIAVQSMWSDQFDVKLQACGRFDDAAALVRGDPAGGRFMLLYRDGGGALTGALGINQAKDMRFAQMLVEKRAVIDPALLADPAQDLRKLGK